MTEIQCFLTESQWLLLTQILSEVGWEGLVSIRRRPIWSDRFSVLTKIAAYFNSVDQNIYKDEVT